MLAYQRSVVTDKTSDGSSISTSSYAGRMATSVRPSVKILRFRLPGKASRSIFYIRSSLISLVIQTRFGGVWDPTGRTFHMGWWELGAANTTLRYTKRKRSSHVEDEITVIFKRRLFLFTRQLGAINDTCSVRDARLRLGLFIELVALAVCDVTHTSTT